MPDRPAFCHRELNITSLQLIIETIACAKNESADLFFFPLFHPRSDDSATLFFLVFFYGNSIIRSTQMCRGSFARGNVSVTRRFQRRCNFAIALSSLPGFRFEEDYTDWSIAGAFTDWSVWAFSISADSTNLWSVSAPPTRLLAKLSLVQNFAIFHREFCNLSVNSVTQLLRSASGFYSEFYTIRWTKTLR